MYFWAVLYCKRELYFIWGERPRYRRGYEMRVMKDKRSESASDTSGEAVAFQYFPQFHTIFYILIPL
jgi:hypothetical protein